MLQVSKKAKATYRGKQFKPASLLMKWLVEPLLVMGNLHDWDALVLWWTSVGYGRFLNEGAEPKNRQRAAHHLYMPSGAGITPTAPDGEEVITSRFSSPIAQSGRVGRIMHSSWRVLQWSVQDQIWCGKSGAI